IPDWPPSGATAEIWGSWDNEGKPSTGAWNSHVMARDLGDDGCPLFRATIQLNQTSAHQTFEWGVKVTIGARTVWAIPTEVKDTASTRQTRIFTFSGNPQQEVYYLTHCRRLGSN